MRRDVEMPSMDTARGSEPDGSVLWRMNWNWRAPPRGFIEMTRCSTPFTLMVIFGVAATLVKLSGSPDTRTVRISPGRAGRDSVMT